jgi:sulfonate transport system substrate-binding protein
MMTSSAIAELPAEVRIGAISSFEKGKLSVSNSPLVQRVIEEGWLEAELAKRGVKLVWFPIMTGDTGASTNEAFAAKRIDFGNYGDLPSLTLNAGGIKTQVIVPAGPGSDTFLLVGNDSKAKSIEDLKGQRISLHRGRPWEIGFLRLIESKQLKYSDFKMFNINPQAGAAALSAGSVEALYTNGAYLLEEKGVGKIIWSTKDAPLDWKMRAELWGAAEFTEKYPELTQLVATAYVKAAYWAAQTENRDAVIKIGTTNGTPESVVKRGYDDPTVSWKDRWNPLFDDVVYTHYRNTVDFATSKKLIGKKLDSKQLLEPKYLTAALKELKLENYWSPRSLAGK